MFMVLFRWDILLYSMCGVGTASPAAKQPAARRLRRMSLGRSPLCRLDCTVLYCTVLYCTCAGSTRSCRWRPGSSGSPAAPPRCSRGPPRARDHSPPAPQPKQYLLMKNIFVDLKNICTSRESAGNTTRISFLQGRKCAFCPNLQI